MSLRIKISKRISGKNVIKLMILFVCFERILETMGFPHSIIFLLDIFNLFLLLQMYSNNKINMIFKSKMVKIHMLIFGIGIAVAITNGIEMMLIVWALRNLFRFYIFFGACCAFLKIEDIYDIFDMLEELFFINIMVLLVQFILGYRQDFLGGIFGSTTGANTYSNVFIVLVCAYSTAKYFEKKESFKKFFLIITSSLIIAVITETKILFFEVAIIICLSIVLISIIEKKYKTLIKGFCIAAVVVLAIVFGAKKMAELYPSLSNSGFLSIDGLLYILTRESGYTGYGDLNRLTAIKTLNKMAPFSNDAVTRFFGMGLGAAEYSSNISLLQSSFYRQYEYLHYFWFSHAWMYLECGYLGLCGYIVGFFSNIPCCIKKIKKCRRKHVNSYLYVAEIVCLCMTFVLYLYNQSLRLESAFLLYFMFSAVYIGGKEVNEKT